MRCPHPPDSWPPLTYQLTQLASPSVALPAELVHHIMGLISCHLMKKKLDTVLKTFKKILTYSCLVKDIKVRFLASIQNFLIISKWIDITRLGLRCQTPLRSYPSTLDTYPLSLIPYPLFLIPYLLSLISYPLSLTLVP